MRSVLRTGDLNSLLYPVLVRRIARLAGPLLLLGVTLLVVTQAYGLGGRASAGSGPALKVAVPSDAVASLRQAEEGKLSSTVGGMGNDLRAGSAAPIGATATATPCTISFTDVDQSNPFYAFIRCQACRGIVAGYNCGGAGEPCDPQQRPYFRWGADVTRGQLSKIISGAANFQDPIPSTQQTFEDVPPTQPFWLWIERLYLHGAISGYPCGGPGEPCGPGNRP